MPFLAEHDLGSLRDEMIARGHNPFHAGKILRDFFTRGGTVSMDSLPRSLKEFLLETSLMKSRVAERNESGDGTIKLLIELTDGATVESVLMPSHRVDRAAGCISSQVGCAMGCDFCASTRGGLSRNLASDEIIEQFLHLRAAACAQNRRLNSLVFMGMGEPMQNLDAVIGAIEAFTDIHRGAMSGRHITVSTVGLVPRIERLMHADLGVHLAISLHAPDESTRQRLVPTARKFRIADILSAARKYQDHSQRISTIEYCLLDGVNDSDAQAHELAALLDGFRAHVNVIPYNAIGRGISGVEYRRPSGERIVRFIEILRSHQVVTHVRQTRGDDVNAACGQLRERIRNQFVQLSVGD